MPTRHHNLPNPSTRHEIHLEELVTMAKRNNQEFVYESLRDLGEVTAKQVMAATGLSNSATTDNLRRLVAAGRVERREIDNPMAAGSGTVVLWRVLEQHEIPAGADEPPVNPADVAEALDEIATHQGEQPPTVVRAAYKGDHQDAAVVELPDGPVLDPAAEIVVDDDRPASVADALREQGDAGHVDLNVMEPHVETPADGHYATADDVDAAVAARESDTQTPACSPEPEPASVESAGSGHQTDAETAHEPASSNPGDVLAFMQSVRPVSPGPRSASPLPARAAPARAAESRATPAGSTGAASCPTRSPRGCASTPTRRTAPTRSPRRSARRPDRSATRSTSSPPPAPSSSRRRSPSGTRRARPSPPSESQGPAR
ncbi:hypothetical protein [Micromonospora sp. 4G55]|uniref:hypothetical protein n=1 Tax=Micromonospora sp. 4G55 TaxID=2806102 RepID=UPI001A5F4793|nr:hypothetical protein [Micromonospora sp. 4G55]MBM0256379.1 hypothetical protein [Micromonospora sp. 4G55]